MTSQKVEVIISGENAGLLNALQGAGKATENMALQMESAVGGIAATFEKFMAPMATFLGVLGGGALFKEAVSETAQFGDELAKSSQKVGVSVESLSGLAHAATLSGVAFEDLTGGLGKLAKNMQLAEFTPASPAAAAFRALGIQVVDAQGHLRGTEAVLDDVAEKFSHMEDGAGKTALAMNLFGRSGKDLIPFLNEGAEGLAEMKAEAQRLGISMSTEQAKAAEKYKDDMERVDETLKGLKIRVANEVMPALDRMATWFTDKAPAMLEGIGSFMKGLGDLVGNTIVQITALAAVFSYTLYPALMKAVVGIQTFMVQMALARMEGITFTSFLGGMINPWMLAAAAIAGVAIGLNVWATSYSKAATEKAEADLRMRESSIQTGTEFHNLSGKAASLTKRLQETVPGSKAHKEALEGVNSVVAQMVSAYPEFLSYLHKENGEYIDLNGSMERFTKNKIRALKSDLEDELRDAQEARNATSKMVAGTYKHWGPLNSIMNGAEWIMVGKDIAEQTSKEADAHESAAKAIQKQIDALNGLSSQEGKGGAPNLEHPDKGTKAKAAHDAAEAEFDRHLKAEQAAQVAHNNDMAAISMDALQLEERKINLSFAKKLETAREAGASEADLAALENAQLDALDKARSDAAQKQAEARKKIAEQESREARQFLEQYGSAQQGFLDGIQQATQRAGSIFQRFAQASQQMLHGIQNAFSTGIQGILTGTMSLSQGVRTMASGVLQSVAGMVSQLIAHWLLYEVILKALGISEGTQNTGRTSGALVTATAETWAAYAGIPFLGPALAAAQIELMYASMAASTTQAAVAGSATKAAGAAEGGWFDRPTMAVIGEGTRPELVVPDVAFKDFAANLSTNILAQERAAQGYGLQANGYARASAGRPGMGDPSQINVTINHPVTLDSSQRGLRTFGGMIMDGARAAARERSVVLVPGQVFGGM